MAVKVKKEDRWLARLGTALLISAVFLCLVIAVATHFTNYFFIPAFQRYLFLLLTLLLTGLMFLFFSSKHFAITFQFLETGKLVGLVFATLLITGIIFAANIIPVPRIPVSHTLEIHALPAESGSESTISVLKINRNIRAPQVGGAEADLEDVIIQGSYERNPDGVQLAEGTTLIYSAFYSGCITVHLGTSPNTGQVQIRFDAVEEKYSLTSSTKSSTIVNLCSPLMLREMPLKWQAILLLVYFADLVSILTLSEMIVMGLYYLGFNQNLKFQELLRKVLVAVSLVAMAASTLYQLRRIIFYTDETTTYAPPSRPSSEQGQLTFTTIYQESLHTKKFAHSFIFMFMDIYPKLEAVYINQATWNSFNFRSTNFEEWFAVYHIQPANLMPVQVTQADIDHIIAANQWLYHEINLEERGKAIRMYYLPTQHEDSVLITNQDYAFYLLPGSLIEGIAGGQS